MREYKLSNTVEKVKCNMCGKELLVEHGIIKQGVFHCKIQWGYFSGKDGEIHTFDLCESCYDHMIQSFAISPEISDSKELI